MKAKQLTVYVPDAVGTLAHVVRTLADSKVNITGLICVGSGDRSPIRLLVNSPARAKKALQAQGLDPTEEDVLVVALPDKPGALAAVAEKLAVAGINIDYAYASGGIGRKVNTVLCVSDVARASRLAR